jgi:hypothetical protein
MGAAAVVTVEAEAAGVAPAASCNLYAACRPDSCSLPTTS